MKGYPLSDEAAAQLALWPSDLRQLFDELMDDARSDLQRELLHRVVMTGHSLAEVHAFADEIRTLTDSEAFSACTLNERSSRDLTVDQLLRAEIDPLLAFELQGGTIEPNEVLERRAAPPLAAGRESDDSRVVRAPGPPPLPRRGHRSDKSPPPLPRASAVSADDGSLAMTRALNERCAALRISWQVVNLEVAAGVSIRDGLNRAAELLSRGLTVPAMIGPAVGEHRRFVVMLQLDERQSRRAWQLYDPLAAEAVWVHEADLLAMAELPFAQKANRLLTRLFLPTGVSSTPSKSSWSPS